MAAMMTAACSQSDAGITTAVKSKLAADDTVKAYRIDVDTKDKVVTLKGNVDTPERQGSRRRACPRYQRCSRRRGHTRPGPANGRDQWHGRSGEGSDA